MAGDSSSRPISLTRKMHQKPLKRANSSMQLPKDSVVISIKKLIKEVDLVPSKRCIYKVPTSMRNVNKEAYTPKVVSIGPLHRGGEGLKAMEQQKLRYLDSFLTWACLEMEEIVKRLRKREKAVRNCYSEKVKLSSDKFIEMMLLDGCFILELLLRISDENYIGGEDLVFSRPHIYDELWLDLILLENQLPLFVLLDIYNLIPCRRPERLPSVGDLISRFVFNIMDIDLPDGPLQDHVMDMHLPNSNSFCNALHLVDCLRMCYLANTPSSGPKGAKMRSFSPSATRLHEAGVKFKKVESKFLLDLKFDKKLGVLKIPILHIQDSTEVILRNQIAFEQCHHSVRPIIEYIVLIDSIIDTPADVNLLMEKGVIQSIVDSGESICQLFNNLGKQVILGEEPLFFHLCADLRGHCATHWNRWKAILKSQYFHTPWAVISFSAGIILLILTVIQTVCSIID